MRDFTQAYHGVRMSCPCPLAQDSHRRYGSPSADARDDLSARRLPIMSTNAKPSISTTTPGLAPQHREKGIRIFMWPKVIFLYPTAIVALICWAGMWII